MRCAYVVVSLGALLAGAVQVFAQPAPTEQSPYGPLRKTSAADVEVLPALVAEPNAPKKPDPPKKRLGRPAAKGVVPKPVVPKPVAKPKAVAPKAAAPRAAAPKAVAVLAAPVDALPDAANTANAAAVQPPVLLTAPEPNSRGWVRGEYLMWWFNKSPEPAPLVTMDSLADFPPGALGRPFTQTVLGGSSIDPGIHSGARFVAGYWLDSERTSAVEVSYLFLSQHAVSQSVASLGQPGLPALFVPFNNVTPTPIFDMPFSTGGGERALFLALPGAYAGSANLSYASRLQGAELTGSTNLASGERFRLDILGGFRWVELHEDLGFNTSSSNVPGFGPPGLFINTHDQFTTGNDFYGGQMGVRGEYRLGRLVFAAVGKVALGDMSEVVNIAGSSVTNLSSTFGLGSVGATVVSPGGIFAQSTNMGNHTANRFAVVPETNFNVAFDVSNAIRLFAGYGFLYMSDVARPGSQMDRTLNLSQSPNLALGVGSLVGPGRPAYNLAESNFWAQGLNFGFEVRY